MDNHNMKKLDPELKNKHKDETFKTKVNENMHIIIVKSLDEYRTIKTQVDQLSIPEASFNPKYTIQVFGEEEEVEGYKDLKIFLFLSSSSWDAYFKICYTNTSKKINMPIEMQLENFFGSYFSTDEKLFESKLENQYNDYGKIVIEKEDYKIHILQMNDNMRDNQLHINMQKLATLFIDGASDIPLQYNSWNYYIIEENSNLVGFCSLARFKLSIKTYRAMISQFMILPSYQRKGLGFLFLSTIYKNEVKIPECQDISTEDPAVEFIYLRDVVLFSELLPFFKSRVNNAKSIKSEEEFDKLTIMEEELLAVSKQFKLSLLLTKRYEIITKYIYSFGIKNLDPLLTSDVNSYLVGLNKDAFISPNLGRNPIIEFDEEENQVDSDEILAEEKAPTEDEMINKLQESLDEFYKDLSEVRLKCSRILKESI